MAMFHCVYLSGFVIDDHVNKIRCIGDECLAHYHCHCRLYTVYSMTHCLSFRYETELFIIITICVVRGGVILYSLWSTLPLSPSPSLSPPPPSLHPSLSLFPSLYLSLFLPHSHPLFPFFSLPHSLLISFQSTLLCLVHFVCSISNSLSQLL